MTRALVAAAVVALGLAGCSSSSGSSDAAPAPSTVPSSGPSTVGASALSAAAEPTSSADPIEFYSSGRSCVAYQGPDLLLSEEIDVNRPLTMGKVELQDVSGGIDLGRATYVAVPDGEIPLTGSWAGTAPSKKQWDRTGWRDRQPLTGAEVAPGSYYVYLPIRITGTGSYDGIGFDWTDDAGSGTSVWDTHDVYRSFCG